MRVEEKAKKLGRSNGDEKDGKQEGDQGRIHYGLVLVLIETKQAA